MADPLSMAASLIAIVQISGGIISLCYDYRRSVQGAKKDVATLQRELQSLRDVIEQLLKLLDADNEFYLPLLRKINASNDSFKEYEEDFRRLEDRLRSPISKWRQLGHQLLWPLRERELSKDLESIHRMKGIIEFSLVADTALSILEIRKHTRDLRERILDFQRPSVHLSKQQELQVMLEWLDAPNPSFKHNELRKKRAKNTGSWLLSSDAFRSWRDSERSSFWLYGIPGCGKSVLSSAVIEHIQHHISLQARDATLAYYHFDFSDEVNSRSEPMLRSLVAQLSYWNGEPPDSLRECAVKHFSATRYRGNSSSFYRDSIAQPSGDDLINILHGITTEFDETYLVIDALDECIDQFELLEILYYMLSWNTKGLHIVLCSRITPGIASILEPKVMHAIEAGSENVDNDIDTFIQEQLAAHPKLRKWPNRLRDEIRDVLISSAHGMFRWVDCQISSLSKCATARDVKKALKTLPKSLSEAYTSTLRNIDEAHWDYAIKMLMLLAISPKPVTIGEAVDILAIDFDSEEAPFFDEDLRVPDETDIVTMCTTLVSTATTYQVAANGELVESVEIRLAHYTVKEYLLSEGFKLRLSHPTPFTNEQQVHTFAAKVLLAYLLGLKQSLTPSLLGDKPLSRHAAELWVHYYQKSQPDSVLTRLALGLLQSNGDTEPYKNWCKLFDLNRPWRRPDLDRGTFPSPLYYMCSQGIESLVLMLLQEGADPNQGKHIYGTCLQSAAFSGHGQIVRLLLEAGANPNESVYDFQEGLYCNSIVAASAAGHAEIVVLLLKHGADPNNSSSFPTHGSALTEASRRNHIEVVRLLIDAGADPNRYHSKPRDVSPLEAAASRGYGECLRMMLPKASKKAALGGLRHAVHCGKSRKLIEIFVPFIPDGVLNYAAALGYEDLVVDLLAKGAKPETIVNSGYRSEEDSASALVGACKIGNLAIAQRLIDNGANVNAESDEIFSGSYPLASAVIGGHPEIVELLLHHGADVNASGDHGPALQIACFEGNKDIVKLLIEHGASLACGDGTYGGPIQGAVLGNHFEILETVIAAGADINLQAGQARIIGGGVSLSGNAIQAAVATSNMKMLNWLLDHGADVNICGSKNGERAPLSIAAGSGNIEMTRRLLEAGAAVNQEGKPSCSSPAIFKAAEQGHLEVVECLLSAGADANAYSIDFNDQINTLTGACMGKNAEIVEKLLDAGADVHKYSKYRGRNEPPILTAARSGTVDIVRALIKHGANVDEQVEDGWTALHTAARSGEDGIVRALLFEFSASPSLALVNGSLPIHSAASWDHPECIELLVEAVSDVNARSKNGRTPLHWAAASEFGGGSAVEWLLKHDANDALEEHGTNMTARDYAELMVQKGLSYQKDEKVRIVEMFDARISSQF
ncbi:ankyrin repeat-containing domain protein [Whalleya microplaca]|nr:ankyrin repeat-containing domain protein [Whalleya microplaca]